MADKKLTTVYQTDDYDKFKFIDGNRPISHAKKIIESIKDIGVLWQPVLVNERFEIIDGQGRFFAMKTLKKPIIYIMQRGLSIKEVRYLNQNATIWVTKDYIHSYAVGNDAKESYKNFEEVKKQFPEFHENIIMKAASERGLSTDRGKVLKTGNYNGMNFDAMNRAIKRLSKLREIANGIGEIKFKNNVYSAIIFCEYIAEVDAEFSIDQLADSLKKNLNLVDAARNMSIAIHNLNYVYNYKRTEKNRYNIIRKYEDTIAEIRAYAGLNTIENMRSKAK